MDSSDVLFFLAVITVSYRAKYHISNIKIKFHSTCIPNCLNVWHVCQNAKCFHSFFAHYRAPPRVYIIHTPFNNIKQFVSTFKFHQSFAKKTFNSCIFLHSMAYIWQDTSIHIQTVGLGTQNCTRNVRKPVFGIYFTEMISVSYCNLVKRTDNGNKRVHLKSCMFIIDENGQLLVEDSSFFLWNKNSKLLGSTYSYTITYSPNSQSQSRSTFLMVVGMLFTQKKGPEIA